MAEFGAAKKAIKINTSGLSTVSIPTEYELFGDRLTHEIGNDSRCSNLYLKVFGMGIAG